MEGASSGIDRTGVIGRSMTAEEEVLPWAVGPLYGVFALRGIK